ncbi:MAG: hypothetical protein EXQ99_08315 [Alphaproteobacteria bacterium]|nr:hypothetical protein [Alphaproteobacteria bacterium]
MHPLPIFLIAIGPVILYPLWYIFGRTGLVPALSIIVLLPIAGPLFVACILAFARWPKEPRHGR